MTDEELVELADALDEAGWPYVDFTLPSRRSAAEQHRTPQEMSDWSDWAEFLPALVGALRGLGWRIVKAPNGLGTGPAEPGFEELGTPPSP